MPRVLAGSRCAIVAGATGADHLRMVDRKRRYPGIRRVAILADICRLNVILIFTRCIDAVVATNTIARNVDVVKVCGQPCRGRVAILAVVSAADMCRILAGSDYAIMAGAAGTDNLRVVDCVYRCPDVRVVAVLANVCRLNVCGILAGRFNAIVTTKAIAGNANVVKIRG